MSDERRERAQLTPDERPTLECQACGYPLIITKDLGPITTLGPGLQGMHGKSHRVTGPFISQIVGIRRTVSKTGEVTITESPTICARVECLAMVLEDPAWPVETPEDFARRASGFTHIGEPEAR